MIDSQTIQSAYDRIKPYIRKTPLEYSFALSNLTQSSVSLKMECWQHTGSFKPRGAFNCLLSMSNAEKQRGIVAPTAGNHGIGLSFAASRLGIPSNIYLPEKTDPIIIETLRSLNAKITTFTDIETARIEALKSAERENKRFISAYNDECMIAGGGSVGIEILQDMSDVDVVIVCVGGGGLISGIATILKEKRPDIQVWGAQTKNSPTFKTWFDAGKTVDVDLKPSIAAGLSGYIEPETITFPIVQTHVDKMIVVTENELIDSMVFMMKHHQQVVEPSGAAAIAAARKESAALSGKKVVAIATGKNISFQEFKSIVY